MPSLRELQTRVMDGLLSGPLEGAVALVGSTQETALSRLQVYRNNVRTNFVDALHSSYPAIRRLVGAEYFRQIAREFHSRNPSQSGDLLHAGRFFPDYLAHLHGADEFRYLTDVARLEWLVQETLLAAEQAPLNLQRLATVEPAAYDTLCFELHPTLRLFESPYPALRIREVNVGSDAEPEPIDLDGGADRVALMRRHAQLNVHRLSQGEYRFLCALRRGEPFAAAIDAGSGDVEFDASAALQRCVAIEAIVDFR